MPEFIRVAKLADFSGSGLLKVMVKNQPVLLVRLGETVRAVSNACTHAEGNLDEGELIDGEIECPVHGSRFDLMTGEAKTPPATQPLPLYQVKMEGEDIHGAID